MWPQYTVISTGTGTYCVGGYVSACSSTTMLTSNSCYVSYPNYGQAQQRDPEELAREESAAERARALLLSHLTTEQRETFETNGWFVVEGGRSGYRYKVRGQSYVGNVERVDDRAVFCAHCDSSLPLGDQLLAQKMMLECAEDEFLRIANRR